MQQTLDRQHQLDRARERQVALLCKRRRLQGEKFERFRRGQTHRSPQKRRHRIRANIFNTVELMKPMMGVQGMIIPQRRLCG